MGKKIVNIFLFLLLNSFCFFCMYASPVLAPSPAPQVPKAPPPVPPRPAGGFSAPAPKPLATQSPVPAAAPAPAPIPAQGPSVPPPIPPKPTRPVPPVPGAVPQATSAAAIISGPAPTRLAPTISPEARAAQIAKMGIKVPTQQAPIPPASRPEGGVSGQAPFAGARDVATGSVPSPTPAKKWPTVDVKRAEEPAGSPTPADLQKARQATSGLTADLRASGKITVPEQQKPRSLWEDFKSNVRTFWWQVSGKPAQEQQAIKLREQAAKEKGQEARYQQNLPAGGLQEMQARGIGSPEKPLAPTTVSQARQTPLYEYAQRRLEQAQQDVNPEAKKFAEKNRASAAEEAEIRRDAAQMEYLLIQKARSASKAPLVQPATQTQAPASPRNVPLVPQPQRQGQSAQASSVAPAAQQGQQAQPNIPQSLRPN